MAIKAKEVTQSSSLQEFRREFNNLVNDVTDVKNNNIFGTGLYFEGSSEDSYETFLSVVNPTADRTIYLPNNDGTLITSGSSIAGTTILVTDNESTSEENAIVFVADGVKDGTNQVSLESDGTLTYNPSSGTLTATAFSGTMSGNASTATALATARDFSITGDVTAAAISFDGTGNVALSAGSVLATNATITANNSTDETVYPVFVDGATGSQGLESDTGLTYNPSSGILTSTQFTGALSGNATTATALATGRTIGMTGDVVWTSASFDGSGNVTGTATIQANSVAMGTDTSGNYVATVAGTANEIEVSGSGSETAAVIVGLPDDVTIGDDLTLGSDGSVLNFGTNSDVSLTHVHDTGLLLNSTMQLQFNDASQNINAPSATVLDINATDEIELNATLVDVNANLDVSGTYTGAGLMTTGGNIIIPNGGNIGTVTDTDAITIAATGEVTLDRRSTHTAGITLANDAQIGSAGDGDSMSINSTGVVTFSQRPVITSGGLTILNDGQIGSVGDTDAITIDSSGNVTASQNLTITGNLTVNGSTVTNSATNTVIEDTIIELNTGASTNSNDIGFVMERGSTGDNAFMGWDESEDKFIVGTTTDTGSSTGNLSITAGTLVVSALEGTISTAAQTNITSVGTLSGLVIDNGGNIGSASDTDAMNIASTGVVTFSQRPVFELGGITIVDGGQIGTVTDSDAMQIAGTGAVTFSQIPVMSAGLNVSGGTITGTIATASQTNITGVGTLNAGSITSGFGTINTGSSTITSTGAISGGSFVVADDGNIGSSSDTDSMTISSTGVVNFTQRPTFASHLTIPNDGQIGSVGDDDAIQIASSGVVTMNQIPVFSAGINVTGGSIAGTLSTVAQTNITSVGTLSSLQIANDGTIGSASDADSMEINSTGVVTFSQRPIIGSGGLTIPNDGQIGSAGDTDAISIASSGVVTMNQIPVFSAGINVSGGSIAGTLSTAAQGNITSLGTLTTLTVDNIIINGTNIGHTSDTDAISIASDGKVSLTQDLYLTGSNDELRFYEGANYVGFEAPALTGDQIWVLPTADASSSGDALVSDGSGNLSFSSVVGSNATTFTLVATNTTDATHYPLFSDAATGNENARTDTGFTYNPNSGILTATQFTGALSGNATTATTATDATNFTVSANNSTDETVYPVFVDGATGSQGAETDTGLNYNPSTGLLSTAQAHLNTDGAILKFGADGEIPLTHVHNTGLRFDDNDKLIFGTASDFNIYHDGSNTYIDNSTGILLVRTAGTKNAIVLEPDSGVRLYHNGTEKLSTVATCLTMTGTDGNNQLVFNISDTAVERATELGKISFKAGSESSGSDAILPGAEIVAVAEGDFTASANPTKIVFSTGISETATETMTLTSSGALKFPNKQGGDNVLLDGTDVDKSNAGDDVIDETNSENILIEESEVLTTQTDYNTMHRMMGQMDDTAKHMFPNKFNILNSSGQVLHTYHTAGYGDGDEAKFGGAVTITVTVAGSKFVVDAVSQGTLELTEGRTYVFDLSDSSVSGHPFRLSSTSNGTHSGGTEYLHQVSKTGTGGSAGDELVIRVPENAPTLYYYCASHGGMGGTLNTNALVDIGRG